jgi:hypothetical protein
MDKTKIIKFDLSHSQHALFQISYKDRHNNNDTQIKYFGMQTEHMNWKTHIGQITPKLSSAFYALSCMYHLTDIDSLLVIYYAYFHSIMTYSIIFWGSSTDVKRVFKLKKKSVRIMIGVNSRISCRPVFKNFKILAVLAQYIFSSITFLQNSEYFIFYHSTHSLKTRGRLQLHRPGTSLVSYQEGVCSATVIIYNCLSKCIAGLVNEKKKFVQQLKSLVVYQSFYSTDQFIEYCSKVNSIDRVLRENNIIFY